jgi:tRNA (cytidine/uridine-2'-O-)-methyltransferase
MDYAEIAEVRVHDSLEECLGPLGCARVFAIETGSPTNYAQVRYQPGDALLFGSESKGLPAQVLARIGPERTVSIPMRPGNRSLNLNNSVALVVYEAWRQLKFAQP